MTRNAFRPIDRQKLRDAVLEQLLAAIDDGHYQPGNGLPSERELMAAMGVGRPAVREALHVLEERGLIVIAHGRRARLRKPEPVDAAGLAQRITQASTAFLDHEFTSVEDLTEARHLFETKMVWLAAERSTPQGIALMHRALEKNRRAISNAKAYLATDMALHRTIAALAGNLFCTAVGEALYAWLPRFHIRMVHVEGANLLSYDEHARIVERIAARDPKGAVTAIEAHLARSHPLYQRFGARPAKSLAAVSPGIQKPRARRGA